MDLPRVIFMGTRLLPCHRGRHVCFSVIQRTCLFLRHPVGLDCHTLLRKVRNDEYGCHPEGGRAIRRDPVELGYASPGMRFFARFAPSE